MTLQRTFSIIKPDAVGKNAIGDILAQIEKTGFRILSLKKLEITKHQAEQFYAVHASRPFFSSLTDFMSSGPIVVLEQGTIRKKWASSIEHNAIHGSDAEETARFELSFFFAGYELA